MNLPAFSKLRFSRRTLLWLVALSALVLAACFSERVAGGSTSTETGTEIQLTGRVIDKDNDPVSGIIVTLSGAGFVDTTDNLGRYSIVGDAAALARRAAPGEDFSDVALDTLVFSQSDFEVATLPVTKWIDTLPDVKIIQRDISGLLSAGTASIARVEAVISGDGIPVNDPVVIEFFYNAISSHYSGYAYFRGTNTTQSFSVYIRVFDALGRLTGRSAIVPFNSTAGDILIPSFDPRNAIPIANAGRDTISGTSTMLTVTGSAVDSFGGTIIKREWDIGGTGVFRPTASWDTTIQLPAAPGNYPNILRVTDNDGNVDLDTMHAIALNAGLTWTARTSGTTRQLKSVVWTGTQLVAVGQLGTVLTSPDGITWILRASGTTTNFFSVIWANNLLVAVGDGNQTYTSPDAITWTRRAGGTSPSDGQLHSITWTGSQFVAVGRTNNLLTGYVRTSPDGVSWTQQTLGAGIKPFGITWTGNKLVVVGGDGLILLSPDGINWTNVRLEDSTEEVHSVIWTGNRLWAFGNYGYAHQSLDGVTWTTGRTSTTSHLIAGMWTGTQIVAVGEQAPNATTISPDNGVTWVRGQTNAWYLNSVAWTGLRIVAVGEAGVIITSP